MAMNRRDFGKVMLGVTGGLLAGAQLTNVAYAGEEKAGGEKHDHECAGKNECKGQGGCKSGDAGCAGKNSCKGKGGCKVPVDPAHTGG
jgi:hypothetical protein